MLLLKGGNHRKQFKRTKCNGQWVPTRRRPPGWVCKHFDWIRRGYCSVREKKSISQQILRPKPNPTANANGKKTGETASHSGLQFIYRVNVYRTRKQKQFNIWKCSCTFHDAPKHAHVNQNASLFFSLSFFSLYLKPRMVPATSHVNDFRVSFVCSITAGCSSDQTPKPLLPAQLYPSFTSTITLLSLPSPSSSLSYKKRASYLCFQTPAGVYFAVFNVLLDMEARHVLLS